jgi:hypothetical protein
MRSADSLRRSHMVYAQFTVNLREAMESLLLLPSSWFPSFDWDVYSLIRCGTHARSHRIVPYLTVSRVAAETKTRTRSISLPTRLISQKVRIVMAYVCMSGKVLI